MAKKTTEPKISPEDYRELLEHVELKTILLESCSIDTVKKNLTGNLKLDVRHEASYVIEGDLNAVVTSRYELVATRTTKKEFALKISCRYEAILTSTEPLTDAFMEIFVAYNVQMNTWPYFREFVQSITQLAGFPSLTLPLFKQ